MYGVKPNDRSVDKIRYDRARQKYRPNGKSPLSCVKGLDISLLPPCQQALRKHILHANYQALIWRKADIAYPDIPHPSGHDWNLSEDILSIDWCEVPVPQQLVDILYVSTTEEEGESTNNEADGDADDDDDDYDDDDDDDDDDNDDDDEIMFNFC